MDLMDSLNGTVVEGIGNEVLLAGVISCLMGILLLAWYSTNLTSTQTRLTNVRIHRRGVTLNRLPDSSTDESRAARRVGADYITFYMHMGIFFYDDQHTKPPAKLGC